MTLLVQEDRRAEALHVYDRLVQVLEVELGVEPDELSRALAKQLRRSAIHPQFSSSRSTREIAERLKSRLDRSLKLRSSSLNIRRAVRLWAERAAALVRLGEPEEALSSIESARLLLGEHHLPVEQSRLLTVEATIYCRRGRSEAARAAAERAESFAREAGELGLAAWALRLQAQTAQQLGRPEQAIALARASTALYDSWGAHEQALRSRRIVALNTWYAGQLVEAEILHRHNLEQARAFGDLEQQAYVQCGLGATLRARGALDAVEPYLLDALALATHLEECFLTLSAEYHLANLWSDRSDSLVSGDERVRWRAQREAQRRFQRVMTLAQASRSHHMLVFGAVDLAAALAQWGRPVEAHPLIELAWYTLSELDDIVSPRAWILVAEAEVALAEAIPDKARKCAAAALPLLERASPAGLAQVHRVMSIAYGLLPHRRLHY